MRTASTHPLRLVLSAVVVFVLAAACAPSDEPAEDGGEDDGVLGASAQTELLAEATLEELPAEAVAWTAHEVAEPVEHEHGPAFLHAREAAHTVVVDGEERTVEPGESVHLPADTEHRHVDAGAWEIVLAAPDAAPPPGASEPLFSSGELEGVPEPPVALRFILVRLPPGTQTSVHTHPGPEYVYTTQGRYQYENGIEGETTSTPGDDHPLPAGVPVQKRNPGEEEAEFLSWFVVDPDEPFAPPAEF